jgi:hypothetical protein
MSMGHNCLKASPIARYQGKGASEAMVSQRHPEAGQLTAVVARGEHLTNDFSWRLIVVSRYGWSF